MFVHEKSERDYSIVELLLHLRNNPQPVMNKNDILPTMWRERLSGKQVILFAIGKRTFDLLRYNVQSVCGLIDYVREIVENSYGYALLWYDDGSLLKIMHPTKGNEEIIKNKGAYYNLEVKFKESKNAFRIEKDEVSVLCNRIDVCYGDKEILSIDGFSDKEIFVHAPQRQILQPSSTLKDWLVNLSEMSTNEVCLPKNYAGRRVVLCYMMPLAVLIHPEKAVTKLERLVSMASVRKKLFFCWAEDECSDEILQLINGEQRARYLNAREKIKKLGKVISISDACAMIGSEYDIFYGDYSGLLNKSRYCGVPTIHLWYGQSACQHNTFGHNECGISVQFVSHCLVGDYCYFALHSGNALCRAKKGSIQVELVSFIPCNKSDVGRKFLFSNITYFKGKLFMLPLLAEDVMIYELETSTWRTLSLSDKYVIQKHNKGRFGSGIKQGKLLWGIPVSYTAIVSVDMDQEKISYYDEWSSSLLPYVTICNSMHWSGVGILDSKKIWFVASQSRHVVCFDTDSKKSVIYELDAKAQGLYNIVHDGEWFWISTARKGAGDVIKWRPDKGIEKIIENFVEDDTSCAICAVDGDIWGFVPYRDCYVKYNTTTGNKEYVEHFLDKSLRGRFGNVGVPFVQGNHIIIYPLFGDIFVKLNFDGTVEMKIFSFSENDLKEYINCNISKNVYDETEFYDDNELLTYMEYISRSNIPVDNAGKRIYKKVKMYE